MAFKRKAGLFVIQVIAAVVGVLTVLEFDRRHGTPATPHALPGEPGWFVVDVQTSPDVGVFCLVKPEEVETRAPWCWLGMRDSPQ